MPWGFGGFMPNGSDLDPETLRQLQAAQGGGGLLGGAAQSPTAYAGLLGAAMSPYAPGAASRSDSPAVAGRDPAIPVPDPSGASGDLQRTPQSLGTQPVNQETSPWMALAKGLANNADSLMSFGAGLASSPTWGQGIAKGVEGMQKADLQRATTALAQQKLTSQQAGQNATYRALIAKGASPEEAIAGSLGGNTALANSYLQKKDPSLIEVAGNKYWATPGQSLGQATTLGPAARDLPELTDVPVGGGRLEKQWLTRGATAGTSVGVPYEKKPETVVNLNQEAEKTETKGRMEGLTKRFNEIATDGGEADTDLRTAQRVQDLLRTVNPGTKTALMERLRQETGIALDPNASNVQGASAALEYLVPRMRIPGSGSSSDRDMNSFRASLPSLKGTPEGNEIALQTIGGLAQHRKARAEVVQQWQLGDLSAKEAQSRMDALPDPFETFKTWQERSKGGEAGTTVGPAGRQAADYLVEQRRQARRSRYGLE